MGPQGRLASANVGDSGFVVLGRTKERPQLHKKYHSPQQEHQFGYPYQLGHHGQADSPEDAMLLTLPVCTNVESRYARWFSTESLAEFWHLSLRITHQPLT